MSTGDRNRALLRSAAADLARVVLDRPGLERELYLQAVQVLNLATARQGPKPRLSVEEQWALHEFIAARIAEGMSVEDAAATVAEDHPERFKLEPETLARIFKASPAKALRKK